MRSERGKTMQDTDREAASYMRPMDETQPMYGKRTIYGNSERLVYPCNICSGADGFTLVLPDELGLHARAHAAGYAQWLAEQGAGA